ncbi:MAG TPA: hypothetical protein PK760_05070, partial [Flavobacteriales bacterium]|nr:hypothetical protein [Flavobacteriales bacterium]
MIRSILSSLAFCVAAIGLNAQVTVIVQEPINLGGPLDFTEAAWGLNPPLSDTANTVVANACFVDDGTAADSLGCGALVNGSQIAGKIAVVYRGVCEFGAKAMNAQNAGAVAVVIINNVAGAPVAMGAGAVGANVTIPVVMISQASGELLRDAIATCSAVLFLGNQTGVYQYNLGFYKADVLIPRLAETSPLIATNGTEFSMSVGAWMRNYGSADMDNAVLHAVITKNGSVVYDETSSPSTLVAGTELFVTLTDFTEATGYSGHYVLTYTLEGGVTDEFTDNNSISCTLTLSDRISYVPANPNNNLPQPNLHAIGAGITLGMLSCVPFKDAHASRLASTGLWFSAGRAADTTLTDEIMTATLYRWDDAVTASNTLPTDAGISTSVASGEFFFADDLHDSLLFIPFTDPATLIDDQWYLACIESYSAVVRHGWDNSLDYTQVQTLTNEPISALKDKDAQTWYNGFTGITGAPAIGIEVVDANSIGIAENNEVSLTPFPNPTCNVVRIPLKGRTGTARLNVYHADGTLVMTERTSVGGDGFLTVDLSSVANGTYAFSLNFD